jgi:hypothetical protein
MNPFPLTYLRLRFTCRAETPLVLGGLRAGSNLRGALLAVMRRATCIGDPSDPAHAAACPVCWLAAADDHPGQERRGYAIAPPLTGPETIQAGEELAFHISLFGEAARYLPYFVLAVPEAGRNGMGPGRGRFSLKTIHAEHPLIEDWPVLKEGENVVRPPSRPVAQADILQAAESLAVRLEGKQPRLRLDFHTPLRLILDGHLLKAPDFGVLFSRLLERLDELAIQHAGGSPRPAEDRQAWWELADRVRLVKNQARWVEVPSGSSRTGQRTWISGMVGSAWYNAPTEIWHTLLPWLLWGEAVQVGKDTSKGNGIYRVEICPSYNTS